MGWSDKAKASGGSTEGVITDYSFMDTFPFGDGEKDDDDNIYMLLEVTPDGADEPNKRSLYLGSGQFLKIEDDGKTLVSSDDEGTPRLYDGGEVFKFIESLEAAGFPAESRFPDINEEKKINFEGMIGTRVRVVNEIDAEATKKFGKRKVKKGKHKGKEFNRTYTKVTKVFEVGDGDEKPAKKNASAKAKAGAAKGKTKKGDDEEDEQPAVSVKAADKFLKALIGAQPKKTLDKGGLALAITRYAAKTKMDTDDRDVMRNHLVADDFAYIADAAEREVVTLSKKGVIGLADEDEDEDE